MSKNFCQCSKTVQESWGTQIASGGQANCSFCDLPVIDQTLKTKTSKETERSDSSTPEVKVVDQVELGLDAAQRTEKYASLFEDLGNIMQVLNVIGACVLIAAGFFIAGPGWVKLIYWIAVLILWGFSYLQTSLIRGLASYFQMKASDHIIRHLQK